MDVKRIASQLGLEEDDIYGVLELFVQTAPSDLNSMTAAFDKQDMAQVGRAAHSLKGSTGTLGFMEISSHAQLIMQQSRENEMEALTRTVPSFQQQMNDLLAQIEEALQNRQGNS